VQNQIDFILVYRRKQTRRWHPLGLMNNANRQHAPNCRRVACRMTESDLTSSRLLANDIQRLAVEYRDWRLAGADEVWFKT